MSFIGKLFGAKDPQVQYTPPGFNAGGLSASFGGNGYTVTPSADRSAAVAGLSGASAAEADVLGGLRSTVGPGFNDLLKARLTDINNTASAAIGNLRQNLGARRILGSSFGNDTINRAQVSYQQQRDATIADNFLKSISVNQQLTQQEFAARRQQYQVGLDELNLEASIASTLTNSASTQLAQNARTQADLDAKAQEGTGKFFGNLLGKALPLIAAPFTGGASLAALPFTSGMGGNMGLNLNNNSGFY